MEEIRIGIVGTRRGMFVAEACGPVGGMAVRSVFDVDEAAAGRAAGGIPGCRAFGPGDWEAFLDSGLDAVVVASPIPAHAGQAAACLDRGLHVLSEVPAAATVDEARLLVRAAATSRATYMLAENCCYLDAAVLLARMAGAGELGRLTHAEGGYLHDCRHLLRDADGRFTWRARRLGVYCTHPLGPILTGLDDRVATVSCMASPAAVMDPEIEGLSNHLMLMRTAGGRTIFLRVDHMSPRPYRCHFHVQGTGGVFEFNYLEDDAPRIALGEAREWQDAAPLRARHLADRAAALPEGAEELGHGTMEYWMLKAWSEAVRAGRPAPIDVHRGLDFSLPGIAAAESAARGGEAVDVPDSREWE